MVGKEIARNAVVQLPGLLCEQHVSNFGVECSLPETPAQHLLRAVRNPRLKASDSDPRPTQLANT